MPIKPKSTPGPRGQSCLTCRHRRKKCDKGRPFCERCLKGKFSCLGYDDYEPELQVEELPRENQLPVTILPVPQMRVGVEFEEAVSRPPTRSAYFGTFASASEINDYLTPSLDSLMVPGPPESSLLTAAPPMDCHDSAR